MPNSPESPDTPSGSATIVQHGPPPLLTPGNVLGSDGTERFRLVEEIARGGMGVVYLARDLAFDRDVGLKTLLKMPAEGSAIGSRFREEARITGQLQHPNIPPVHDLGTLPDGRPYLAMKLIKGRTLDAMLKDRPDPTHDRGKYLAVFENVAQAVAYAHAHRVIHRDLKPLNVMVGTYGEVQVMDWGLAKVLTDSPAKATVASVLETAAATDIRPTRDESDGSDETRAGSIFGTPAYMPREQAIGAVDQIDTRSDVFSLGGVLCAILTGKPPYVGADAESTRQLAAIAKLDDAFARLDSCGAEPGLVALAKRCLAAERDERPRNAGEVARAVADLRAESEKRARQAELDRARAEEKAAEQRKRRKVQLALLVAVILIVTGGGAFGWWEDRRATAARTEEELRKLAQQAEEDRRKVHTEREVTTALTEMNALCDRGSQEIENPPRWRLTLGVGRSAQRRGAAALAAGPASDEVRAKFREATERLEREEFDCETAEMCEQWLANMLRHMHKYSKPSDLTPLQERLKQLFFRADIPLGASPDDVVTAIERSQLRYTFTGILLFTAGFPLGEGWREAVKPVATLLARRLHPVQNALRQAHGEGKLAECLTQGLASNLTSNELLCLYLSSDATFITNRGGRELLLDEAIRRNPANLLALALRGGASGGKRSFFAMIDGQVVELVPTPTLPHSPVHSQAKPLTEEEIRGIVAHSNAIAHRPDLINLRNWAGEIFASHSLFELAIEQFRSALALDQTRPDIQINLADALLNAGRIQEALEAYRIVMAKFPAVLATEHPEVWRNAARCAILLAHADPTSVRLTDDQRQQFRLSALRWLREWTKGHTLTGKEILLVTHDPALRFVRDSAYIDQLPPGEAARWCAFWDHIRAIRPRGTVRYLLLEDYRRRSTKTSEPHGSAPPPREVKR